MTPRDYWSSGAGLGHIAPPGDALPEGEDFGNWIAAFAGPGHVLDFGCGTGRFAGAFDHAAYTGMDICPAALDQARAAHPEKVFVADHGGRLPLRDATLCHTVLLHIPDDQLAGLIDRFTSPRVLVSEILGRHWRREGDPPVFNREAADYVAAFAPRYRLIARRAWPYRRYGGEHLAVLVFERGPVRNPS